MKIYNNLIPETDTDADVNYTYQPSAWDSIEPVENDLFVSYTTTGTYTWTCPAGVTSVSVVAIGGGGGGAAGATADSSGGGGGGGLGWKNNISVTPGTGYTVVVGSGGAAGSAGGQSYFINASTVAGNGGGVGILNGAGGAGGTYVGDGGGNGGNGGAGSATDATDNLVEGGGGGGAGGYNGNGGTGASGSTLTGPAGSANSGAAGGGASADSGGGDGGGGVSVYGIGLTGGVATGSGGSYGSPGSGGFEGASGGTNGGAGGLYGGGGGGADGAASGAGANGAVAIFYTSNYFSTTIKIPTPSKNFIKFWKGVSSSLASPFLQIENITSYTNFDTTVSKWFGGVLAPNNFIYGIPYSSTSVLKINTLTDEVTTFGNISGSTKYSQGALAHTGNVYFAPWSATNVLKINTSNDSISTIAFPSGITSFASRCACVSDSGHIFMFSVDSKVMRLTPSTDTLIKLDVSFDYETSACILAPNNYIYIESNVGLLKFNPKNFNTTIVDATISSQPKLSPNGYIFRSTTSGVRVFDPQTDTQVRSFNTTSTGSGNYSSMSFDGKLVTINLSGSIGNSINIRVIDTVTENVSFFNIPSRLSADQFAGIVRGAYGDMYLIPYTGRYVSKINFNISNNFSSDFYLSKYM